MRKVVLASGNKGKLEELRSILNFQNVQLIAQSEFDIKEAEETGNTFVENALIKARHACIETGLPSIADDSGIEVDALNGEPGVYSARYAGENASYLENCAKVLNKLDGTRIEDRTARFRTVMAFVGKNEKFHCEGSVDGLIIDKKIGKNGFGYDPIFYYPKLEKTFAELNKNEKNSISHRGKALRNFCDILEKQLINKNG